MIHYEVESDHVGAGHHARSSRGEARADVEMRDRSSTRYATPAPTMPSASLLITATGDAFCAGMDLSASTVAKAAEPDYSTRSTTEALRVGVQAFIRELWELDKPTVAAVNGAAVGPGAHLALACDFVLVHESTRFLWSFPGGASSSTPAAPTCSPASSGSRGRRR